MEIKELELEDLISTLCDSLHYKDENLYYQAKSELLSRYAAGKKAIKKIQVLEKMFCADCPEVDEEEVDSKLRLKRIDIVEEIRDIRKGKLIVNPVERFFQRNNKAIRGALEILKKEIKK